MMGVMNSNSKSTEIAVLTKGEAFLWGGKFPVYKVTL